MRGSKKHFIASNRFAPLCACGKEGAKKVLKRLADKQRINVCICQKCLKEMAEFGYELIEN